MLSLRRHTSHTSYYPAPAAGVPPYRNCRRSAIPIACPSCHRACRGAAPAGRIARAGAC